jgi:ankyrin repeat protein
MARDDLGILLQAAWDGDAPAVTAFLQAQGTARIDDTDGDGQCALSCAFANDHEDMVLLLLHHGADRNRPFGATKITPLMAACEKRMSCAIEKLVTLGVQIDAQQPLSGDTALIKAVRAQDGWAACRLISAGADAARANTKGETAENLAAQCLSDKDLGFFTALLAHQREEAVRAWQAAQQRVRDESCMLQQDIAPLKPLTLRPRPPKL